jgi:hypothetical protein
MDSHNYNGKRRKGGGGMIKLTSVKTLSELQAEHSKQLQEAEAKPKTAGKVLFEKIISTIKFWEK